MKLASRLLLCSLVGNILLAAWVVWHRAPAIDTPPPAGQTEGPTAPRKRKHHQTTAPAPLPVAAQRLAKVTWADIQSDDLKELIRRLRGIGCPEPTIQDLILAEVNRRFQARKRKLSPERYQSHPYWQVEKRDPLENKKNRELWRKERELDKEKSALLVELLGIDPEKARRAADGLDETTDWREAKVAFLPESKREAVLNYLDDFDEKAQDFYDRNRGLWDAQYRAEQRQMEVDRLKGLEALLTPQEFREFELRQSQLASQLRYDLGSLSLTREQYEAIYDIRKKYGDSIYNYGDNSSPEARQLADRSKEAMQAELKAALGPAMGKDYERSQDYSYKQLTQLARHYELPADTANRVYDFKEVAEASVKKIREDQSMTNEQRQAALKQIGEETQKAVQEALGEQNYKRYQRVGGWWINSLSSPGRSIR